MSLTTITSLTERSHPLIAEVINVLILNSKVKTICFVGFGVKHLWPTETYITWDVPLMIITNRYCIEFIKRWAQITIILIVLWETLLSNSKHYFLQSFPPLMSFHFWGLTERNIIESGNSIGFTSVGAELQVKRHCNSFCISGHIALTSDSLSSLLSVT